VSRWAGKRDGMALDVLPSVRMFGQVRGYGQYRNHGIGDWRKGR
jgi:hypothetical protein